MSFMENLLIDSFDFNPFDIDYGLDQFPGKGGDANRIGGEGIGIGNI